jgi:hypothetical protein
MRCGMGGRVISEVGGCLDPMRLQFEDLFAFAGGLLHLRVYGIRDGSTSSRRRSPKPREIGVILKAIRGPRNDSPSPSLTDERG